MIILVKVKVFSIVSLHSKSQVVTGFEISVYIFQSYHCNIYIYISIINSEFRVYECMAFNKSRYNHQVLCQSGAKRIDVTVVL